MQQHDLISRRIGWIAIDQGISSLTNFGVTLWAARVANLESFGAFAVAYTAVMVVIGFVRSLVCEPLLVKYSADQDAARRAAPQAATLSVAFSLVGLILLSVGAVIATKPLSTMLLLAALVIPLLVVQDVWRYAFIAASTPRWAAVMDGVWALGALSAFLLGPILSFGDFAEYPLAAWGLAGGLSLVVVLPMASPWASISEARDFRRNVAGLALGYAGEYLAKAGAAHAVILVIAALVGLEASGAIRGAQLLFGPLGVVFLGLETALVSEGVRVAANSGRHRLDDFVRRLATGMAAGALVYGVGLLFVPYSLGTAVLGEIFGPTRELLAPMTVRWFGAGLVTGGLVGLRALADSKSSFRSRVVSSPGLVVGGTAGAVLGGAEGGILGLGIANLIAGTIWIQSYRTSPARRERGG